LWCGVLRRLGYFIHTTASGKMLVKLTVPRPPRIGSRVFDRNGKYVGRVVDVIGPIRSPYVLVKPARKEAVLEPYDILFLR